MKLPSMKSWRSIAGSTLMLTMVVGAANAAEGEVTVAFQGTSWVARGVDTATVTSGNGAIINNISGDSLVTKNANAEVIPSMAERWVWAPDGKSVEFFLRKGITFQNGEAFTAEDVKFSIERVQREDFKNNYGAFELRNLYEGTDIIDDHHVRIRFKSPYPAFTDRLFEYFKMQPKDYIEEVGDEAYARNPVGAGPFRVVDFKQDSWIEYEAWEGHFRNPPKVKKLRLVFVPEPATIVAMLKTGEADIASVDPQMVRDIKADSNLRLITSDNTILAQLSFADVAPANAGNNSPFHNKKVREAVSYAIDREAISQISLQGLARPFKGILAPWHAGYDPVFSTPDKYDPARAKVMLSEAGYADGFETEIQAYGPGPWWEIAKAVKGYLDAVGIRTKLQLIDNSVHAERCHGLWKGTYALTGLIVSEAWWNARAHPVTPIHGQLTKQAQWSCGVTSDEVDAAIRKTNDIPIDSPELPAAAQEMQRTIYDAWVRVDVVAGKFAMAAGPRIESYENVQGLVFPANFENLSLKAE
ncbi:MAG: ABC transporter substrate-binding protein [Rhizobiaceae bacterium]